MPPKGGVMLGLHRDVTPGEPAFFEFLRIAESGGDLVYYASPAGREATAFKMIEVGADRVVFENPEHDFPQRIGYQRDGNDELVVWIEGDADGETPRSEWRWRRVDRGEDE